MAEKSFAAALNEQISNEFAASQQYVGAAVYYDAETLPRLAAFFYRQALEEREHAMMMIRYLLDVGEQVQIPDVKSVSTTYADGSEPVKIVARAGETGQRRDLLPLRARPRAERLPRRAVPPVVRQGAGRGGRADGRPAERGRALEGTTCFSPRSSSPARKWATRAPTPPLPPVDRRGGLEPRAQDRRGEGWGDRPGGIESRTLARAAPGWLSPPMAGFHRIAFPPLRDIPPRRSPHFLAHPGSTSTAAPG